MDKAVRGVRKFQFTHPGRGATREFVAGMRILKFQFTHPGRGATKCWQASLDRRSRFQFTHPGRGATTRFDAVRPPAGVSIHAPREGCDKPGKNWKASLESFNSRTPGGVRLLYEYLDHRPKKFQFTHPGRGATYQRLC